MNADFLFQAVIFLTAAIVCVPLAKKLGLSSVLGYLFAGILIGPFVLGFVGEEGEDIMHFAEFGVVMMLFLIGLELEPAQFWKMRKMILGLGGLEVIIAIIVFYFIAYLLGFSWKESLIFGMVFSLSSTAIVLQTLKEKGQMNTMLGKSSFSVLLFQDIAVIPMLAVMPLFAGSGHENIHGEEAATHPFLETLPAWLQTVAVLLAVAVVVLAGRFIVVPILRQVAKTRLRELFVITALLLVLAITLLMTAVGLSPALGAFLGGVVLANSEYKHALESDLEPFKGILLGIFFIAVGATIDFNLIGDHTFKLFGTVIAIMAIKSAILLFTGRLFSLSLPLNVQYGLGLSQIGEFAFVLLSFAAQLDILDATASGFLMAATAISMVLSPFVNIVVEKFFIPAIHKRRPAPEDKMDTIDENNGIIIAGFAHFGSTVGRFLRAHGVEATILDYDPKRVDLLRQLGFKVYYGDATRHEVLESAGADSATILISAIDSPETNARLIETAKKYFPNLRLHVRAKNRIEAYELMDQGVEFIYRETLDTSIKMGEDVLKKLGFRAFSLKRTAWQFRKMDEEYLKSLKNERHNTKSYIDMSRAAIQQQEELLKRDISYRFAAGDHAWDSSPMRDGNEKKES